MFFPYQNVKVTYILIQHLWVSWYIFIHQNHINMLQEECTEWTILRIIYADDYILYKFGLKHRVMNRSYINNVFVNIGVFFTTNKNSLGVWGHRCCTVIFVVRKETSYQVIKHIELSYTIFGYFSVVVVVYTKSSKPNRQTNKRWYFEASV